MYKLPSSCKTGMGEKSRGGGRHHRTEWNELISIPTVYVAWCDFARGKHNKKDVQYFEASLENELWNLHIELSLGKYSHQGYTHFRVHDPKMRNIHKASVRDRVVHRLLYNELMPIFNIHWLDCSFSCRPEFGQHRSVRFVRQLSLRASKNYRIPCIAVKLDIRKFFEHIDHEILLRLIFRRVQDVRVREILMVVVQSYSVVSGRGLPIGNLTSQIFANVYLHELDRFVKHKLRKKFYARYADDFICFVSSEQEVIEYISTVSEFLSGALRLSVHSDKIIIRPIEQGIDWLGVVLLNGYSVMRPSTRQRMIQRTAKLMYEHGIDCESVFASYNGLFMGVAHRQSSLILRQLIALIDVYALK